MNGMQANNPNPNQRAAVTNLQRYLRQLSYFDSRIPAPPVDGIFDNATEQAIRAFQRAEGLPETGVADRPTWDLLYRRYLQSLEQKGDPRAVTLFPSIPEGYAVGEGDTQFLVRMIQFALQELAVLYEGLDNVPQSGTYDAETTRAVREFQRRHLLPETGAVDLRTWNALADAFNSTFGGYFSQ